MPAQTEVAEASSATGAMVVGKSTQRVPSHMPTLPPQPVLTAWAERLKHTVALPESKSETRTPEPPNWVSPAGNPAGASIWLASSVTPGKLAMGRTVAVNSMSPETGVTQGSSPAAAVTLLKEDIARVMTSK